MGDIQWGGDGKIGFDSNFWGPSKLIEWKYDNKEALKHVKNGLKQTKTTYRGSFAKYAKEEE